MATVARIRSRLAPRGLAPDPGLAHLRVAARAALVQPLVLAFGLLVLRNSQMTLFMVFAVFSLLVFANFGGSALNRLVTYLLTTLVGGALVAIGTLASPMPWTAALAALVVVFCVEFAGVFSGYVAGSRFPLLLALVLAASVPGATSAVPDQVLGWLIGGSIATAAALGLWPLDEGDGLRNAASAAMRSLAGLVASTRINGGSIEQHQSAANALNEFRTAYTQTPYRPAGANPGLPEGDRLAAAVASLLEASAGVMQGGPSPDLDSLAQARISHRRALDAWAGAQLRSGTSAELVLDGPGLRPPAR